MKIGNLGAGSVRPPPPFINLDSLHELLAPGTPERIQLDSEPNYVEHDIRQPLPFPDNDFDGILLSHVLEHFCAINGANLLRDCYRVLKPGGKIMVSVPDASYHRRVYADDNKKNAMRLFGEIIPASEPKQSFLEYALLFTDHRMVYAEDSLWAMLVNAGFSNSGIWKMDAMYCKEENEAIRHMHSVLNRRMFSLVMVATK